MKRYVISGKRCVVVKKHDGCINVTIQEDYCDFKIVTMPSKRWAHFVSIINRVEESLGQIDLEQDVELCEHIGGGWYVSVCTGFKCVDFRKFNNYHSFELKPTKNGIALRIPEWYILKAIVSNIQTDFPELASETLCIHTHDKLNICSECNAFMYELLSRLPNI